MNEPAFDELLRRLAEADAEFVVVGGLALNAWGVVRGTKDVDIVIATNPENIKRVAEVAVSAGGHVQRGDAFLGTPVSIAAALVDGDQVAIETDLGRLDVVQGRAARLIALTGRYLNRGIARLRPLSYRAGTGEALHVLLRSQTEETSS